MIKMIQLKSNQDLREQFLLEVNYYLPEYISLVQSASRYYWQIDDNNKMKDAQAELELTSELEINLCDEKKITKYPMMINPEVMEYLVIVGNDIAKDKVEILGLLIMVYCSCCEKFYDTEKHSLTKLLNRKAFERLMDDLYQNKLKEKNYFISVIKIDDLTELNKKIGYIAVENILLKYAKQLKKHIMEDEWIFHYGYDEFIWLFPCNTESEALDAVNKLHESVSFTENIYTGTQTLSIGVSLISIDNIQSCTVNKAYQAMFHAQSLGGNQVILYSNVVMDDILTLQDFEILKKGVERIKSV